ncbi:conserved hypothetical protein [Gammaproteobacteria bacterium]
MTHTVTFDTFQYAKRLQKAGFTEIQIEAQIENVREQATIISELINDNLATKQDIKELDLKIETIKNEILIKLGGMIIGGLGALVILMKLFKL